jgi:hypothetical protein
VSEPNFYAWRGGGVGQRPIERGTGAAEKRYGGKAGHTREPILSIKFAMAPFNMHGGQRNTKWVAGAAEKRDGDKAGHTGEPIYE